MTPLTLFLLGCLTVFLGTIEIAFSSLMRLSLRLMADRSGRGDRLGHYLEDPLELFVPARVMIGVCIVLAGVLIAGLSNVRDAASGAIFIASLVAFVVVCEHLLPMLIVRDHAEAVLDVLLPPFHAMAQVLRPLTAVVVGFIAARRSGAAGAQVSGNGGAEPANAAPGAESDAEKDAAMAEEEGRELLQSIVEFTETVVKEVMTPRPDIVAVKADASIDELRDLFREEQYSRMPVYRDSLDNVIGIVFVKDLVALPPTARPPMTTLMRAAFFVPESKRVSELLKDMQRRQAQMAMVVDEYGGTAGLVTVEDLLEEIVGEIRDEYDVESETVTDEGEGVFLFSGKVSLGEVRDRLGVELERDGVETIGGYLLSTVGRMPYVGERFDVDDLGFEVVEVERRRITRVRVRRQEPGTSGNVRRSGPSGSPGDAA